MENNKNTQVAIFLVIIFTFVFGAIFIWAGFFETDKKNPQEQENQLPYVDLKYDKTELGISLDYPENYILSEREVGNPQRRHYSIVFVEDLPENRALLSGDMVGEGPISMSLDIYQSNLDNYGSEEWIKENNNSNYKLSPDGKLYIDEVDGKDALIYKWSGLYEAYSVVVKGKKNIYVFTVNYISMEDSIIDDFNKLIETVRFDI